MRTVCTEGTSGLGAQALEHGLQRCLAPPGRSVESLPLSAFVRQCVRQTFRKPIFRGRCFNNAHGLYAATLTGGEGCSTNSPTHNKNSVRVRVGEGCELQWGMRVRLRKITP